MGVNTRFRFAHADLAGNHPRAEQVPKGVAVLQVGERMVRHIGEAIQTMARTMQTLHERHRVVFQAQAGQHRIEKIIHGRRRPRGSARSPLDGILTRQAATVQGQPIRVLKNLRQRHLLESRVIKRLGANGLRIPFHHHAAKVKNQVHRGGKLNPGPTGQRPTRITAKMRAHEFLEHRGRRANRLAPQSG